MNNKILAVAIVAIICVSAAAVYFATSGEEDGDISIIDGSGKEITLDAPIDNVVLVNTNIPKVLNILGLNDKVKGLSLSAAASGDESWSYMKEWFPNADRMSAYGSLTAEEVGVAAKYVICPVSSMTISETNQGVFEEMGITIIRLDCNGEDMLDDFEKIVKLFGDTEKTKTAFNEYLNVYNSIINTVISKATEAGTVGSDNTFLFLMGNGRGASAGGAFYTPSAELSKITETIYGKNFIRNTDLPQTSVSVPANSTNTPEVIIDENSNNQVSKIFVRSTTSNDPSAIWGSNECILSDTDKYGGLISALGPDTIYTMHSDLLSGPISYIGYILIAEACGISTGLNVTELVEEYNEKYDFNEVSTDYLYKIVYSGTSWNAVSITVA